MVRHDVPTPSRGEADLHAAFAFALRLARVRDFAHFTPAPLIPLAAEPFEGARAAKGLLAGAFCLAVAYAWNEFKDEVEPALTGREPAVLSGRGARAFIVTLALAALGLAAWVGPVSLAAASVSLAVSYLYSGGPRLKRLPGIGTLTNAGIFVPLAFLGLDGPPVSSPTLLLVVTFGMLVLQVQVVHEFAHVAEDRADGILTTARRYGARAGGVVVGVLGGLAGGSLAAIAWVRDPSWVFLAAPLPLWTATAWTLARGGLVPAPTAAASRLLLRYSGLVSGAVAWLAVAATRL